jgi:hypothetical protein
MWFKKAGVNGEVGWRARVWLDIDAPLRRIKSVGSQSTVLAHSLDLVNDLISTVVTSTRKTLGVFVGQNGAQAFNYCLGGEVFRGNQFKRAPLARLFLLDKIVELRIVILE